MSPDPRRAFAAAALVTAVALAAVVFDFPTLLRGPAPYPPEWQWELRAAPAPGPWTPAVACAAALVGLVASAGRARSAAAARGVLAVGTLAGFGLGIALVAVEPGGALQTYARRALSRTITSYLTVAAGEDARDPTGFLRLHADALPRYRKEAKHAATHPPGPVLAYRGLIAVADASPGVARATLRAAQMREEPARPDIGFRRRAEPSAGAMGASSQTALLRPQTPVASGLSARAAAVWGPLLIVLCAALTAWPVAALARALGLDEVAATRVGLLWLLLPGPLLQAPQFDQALALPVALAALAMAAAARTRGARALAFAALAGVCGGGALFFSYGMAVPLAISCAAALWALRPDPRRAALVATTSASVAVAVFASTALLGHAPLRAALTALEIHREAYTAPRSYALWLLFNPVDLFVFLGPPIVVLFAVAIAAHARAGEASPAGRWTQATAAGLALLLLSGTLRGEAGRILIPLMPALLLAATARLEAWNPGRTTLLAALLATWTLTLRARWEIF
ncbi:MAG: hypothetical protein NDJ94_01965 [Vicinamibacteria bacterium]|nr:hypothetical protein [Vicinamibacteria bacterium]